MKKILVVGAGTMGAGIANWFLQTDVEKVALCDINKEQLKKGVQNIQNDFSRLVEKGKITQEKSQFFCDKLLRENFLHLNNDYDLVIEAVAENLDIKCELFFKLHKIMNPNCIFATNTSSLSISKISSHLSVERQQKFLGLHFFNPAPIMKLVEIVQGPDTSLEIIANLKKFFKNHGKVPALCLDRPGFIVNRIARNYYGEALRIVNTHHLETIKEHDEALEAVGGFKMGPFKLMDLIGIDVNLDVTTSIWKSFNFEPRFAPHRLQQDLVNQNFLGKKNNKGFYPYE